MLAKKHTTIIFFKGAIFAPFVITGLHHMTNAIDLELVRTAGGTGLWPMIALSNIAQGSAVFAYYFFNVMMNVKHRFHFQQLFQLILVSLNQHYLMLTLSMSIH